MPSGTPDQIGYFAPVFDALARFEPEELGDDNPEAMSIVEDAVRKRVAGTDPDDARETIQADADQLQAYMATPDAPRTAGYVFGVLFGMTMYADFEELTDE